MSPRLRRTMSTRVTLLLMAAGAALYVAALGTYAALELEPSARALRSSASAQADQYDSLRARLGTLESAFDAVQGITGRERATPADRLAIDSIHATLARVTERTAGVQASVLLSAVSPDARAALAEEAGAESRLAGILLEALQDARAGDYEPARVWMSRAATARRALVGRLNEAQRLALVDLAGRERMVGARATRIAQAVGLWVVLGIALSALAMLVMSRRLFAPLRLLDRGLARVAEGDLAASLPVPRQDELGRLAAHFNEMTAVLRTRPEVEALRQSEVRFRSLIEHSMDLISIVGADGRIRYASPALTPLLGYAPAELDGTVGFDLVHPDDLARVQAAFARALGGAAAEIREEFRFRHRDGSWRFLESVVTNLVDEPTVGGLVVNARDVTERRRAEETLRRERFLVDTLMEHVPDAIYFKDADSRFLRINRATAQRFGLKDPADAIGKTDFDVFASEHAQAAWNDERAILETGQPVVDKEELERWPDRPSAWVSTTKMPLRDEAGRVIGTFGVSRDITERKLAQLELEHSRERFERIFHRAPVAMALSAQDDGRILDVNDEYVELLGYGRDELVGHTSLEVGIWLDRRDYDAMERVATERRAVREYQLRLRAKDGRIRAVRASFQALQLDDRPVLLAAFTDITERREAERRLEESESRFRTAFMTGSDAHVIAGRDDGRIYEVNDQFTAMFGYRRDEAVGRTAHELGLWARPEARQEMLALLAAHGQVRNLEVMARRKDGETFPVFFSASELAIGDPPLLLVLVRDVTELRRSTEALRSLEEQFRQAQRLEAVGRLAGGVAHDFNNVLTAITGTCDLLLLDLAPGDRRREDVEDIKKAAERATTLTRQLLAFSRRQVLQAQTLDLNAVVRALEKMLPRLLGEDVQLTLSLAPDLGAVHADPGQIDQVLVNLAVNARDAMPEGGRLTIETANVELDETYAREHAGVVAGPHVALMVTDTGVGMDAEIQSHIFEPFFTTKGEGKGTGLGLSTVHGIVTQSGGTVWVYSEPGRGTTLKIYLPRVDERVPRAEPTPTETVPGGRETLLLAEDDPGVRRVASQVLTQKGYHVLVAPNGEAALTMARAHEGEITLLVTDLVMPGMTGRELAELLEATRPGLRVLYMSGYTDDSVVRHGVLSEGLAYLQKPFTPQALAAKVREVLDRR
jgi:two-component system cell cycle sensor histidine kinase/response regulator CckA